MNCGGNLWYEIVATLIHIFSNEWQRKEIIVLFQGVPILPRQAIGRFEAWKSLQPKSGPS